MKKVFYLAMLTVLLVSTVFTITACGGSSNGNGGPTVTPSPTATSTPTPGVHVVELTPDGFRPLVLTIKVGEQVNFQNKSEDRHYIQSTNGPTAKPNTGPLPLGQNFTITFDQPGEYPYICLYHKDAEQWPGEQGAMIIVEE